MKMVVSKEHWSHLCSFPQAGSGRRIVKFQTHHVAYNATSKRDAAPLPLNLGSGASVSHLCNTAGCCSGEHLQVETLHRENLVRQRCRGVLLLVHNSVIVQEQPCSHADMTQPFNDQILSSCRKVQIVVVSQPAAEAIHRAVDLVASATSET